MENVFKKFLKGLTVYSAIILIVGAVLFFTVLRPFFLVVFPFVLLFYYVSTLILHQYMLKITKSDASRFGFRFMILSFLKMFIYIVFGVVYIIFDEENAILFLVVYLVLYVAYAIFEVRSVMRLINEKKV